MNRDTSLRNAQHMQIILHFTTALYSIALVMKHFNSGRVKLILLL